MENTFLLRAFVTERLNAAAEEIFALVERTILEYEEELCRFKEENQRKQQLLDSLLTQTANTHSSDTSPGFQSESSVKQVQIKEEPGEQNVNQEEEELPEFSAVCVKSEEQSSLTQQTQRERESEKEQSDGDEECEALAQMETQADGDHYNQDHSKHIRTAAHNSALFRKYKRGADSTDTAAGPHHSRSAAKGKEKRHECPVCGKKFTTQWNLKQHFTVHTGEKPYSCLICRKTFNRKFNVGLHMRVHTGEKPFRCSVCNQTFSQKCKFLLHEKTHRRNTASFM